jgi:hypothetical protein
MKRFFYLSGGMFLVSLSLLIGFHLGARAARADWNGSGIVLGTEQLQGGFVDQFAAVAADGSLWTFEQGQWYPQGGPPLPVPLGDIAFFVNLHSIVDTSGNAWWWTAGRGWINYGPPPLVTKARPATWGSMKSKFK